MERMRAAVFMIIVGIVLIVAPIGVYVHGRRVQEKDLADVARMQARLDSVRAALDAAPTAADSARITEVVRELEYGFGRRTYHIPKQQAALDRWWRPTGVAMRMMVPGALLLVIGLALLRRRRNRVGSTGQQ